MARWNLSIPEATDRAVRAHLARVGLKKGDLSKFVDEAVRREMLRRTVKEVQDRNTDLTEEQALALATEAVMQKYRQKHDHEVDDWVTTLIREAQEEQARHPMSVEDMLRASAELDAYGAEQTKKLGIHYDDIDRLMHEFRARQQS